MAYKLVKGLTQGTVKRDSDMGRNRFIPGSTRGATRQEHKDNINPDDRTVIGVASTINLDRHGEIVLPSAIAAHAGMFLDSNSPFLAAHMHQTDSGDPTQIGWVMDMAFDAETVTCRFMFDTNPVAGKWWSLASNPEGKGIGFSIGFYPKRWVFGAVADLIKQFPELQKVFAATDLADTDRVRVYTEVELAEISGCGVPANRESVQILMDKFFGGRTDGQGGGDGDEKAAEVLDVLAAAIAAKLAGSVGDAIGEVLDALDQVRFEIDDAMGDIQTLIAGDSPLDGRGADCPDCAGGGGEAGAGAENRGEAMVARACMSLADAAEE